MKNLATLVEPLELSGAIYIFSMSRQKKGPRVDFSKLSFCHNLRIKTLKTKILGEAAAARR
jgi:hypothetical protein